MFTKNRDRLLNTEIARLLLAAVLAHKEVAPLLSDEHFSVDGTLIEAWASMKSLQPKAPPDGSGGGGGAEEKSPAKPTRSETEPSPTTETTPMTTTRKTSKDRNAEVDFRGSKRCNETHQSVTDPQARLYRKGKGKPAQLCFMGHALMENRSGLIVEAELTQADGHAERAAAIAMIERHSPGSERRLTLGADKGYDSADFVTALRRMCVTPHVAAKAKGSAIDGRTTRHASYAVSQRKRKQIEEPFGWGKTVGRLRKTMLRGLARVGAQFTLHMAAYNLARMPRLLAALAGSTCHNIGQDHPAEDIFLAVPLFQRPAKKGDNMSPVLRTVLLVAIAAGSSGSALAQRGGVGDYADEPYYSDSDKRTVRAFRYYYRNGADRPQVVIPIRPANCGQFRYWNGERCVDARIVPPDVR